VGDPGLIDHLESVVHYYSTDEINQLVRDRFKDVYQWISMKERDRVA
jgi:hypothetical protein